MMTSLGPYTIEREVGRGGMGVVYLARDVRLNRAVAIKVLPEGLAHDPERLQRFEREARLLAALSHPNIAGIYGIEEADGKRFLVLEYVEGETLAEHLARGPLPLDEALEVCIQIAAALEAAHESGIVHRDLKPGNVKLTPTGVVKVLDFGLAKGAPAGADSVSDLTRSPTITHAATGIGVILGTAAYMSPEQARGKPVDRRTDIWSFGCVLYECLTGAQAFAGETVSDVIALILQGEPDRSKLPPNVPERLRELLGRCLEKDARKRLRDIGDARIELEQIRARITDSGRLMASAALAPLPVTSTARAPRWRAVALGAALLLLGLGLGGGITWMAGRGSGGPAVLRFTIDPPVGLTLDIDPNQLAISPDGRTLVYSLYDSTGQGNIWTRSLGSFESKMLEGTRNAELPFWSPDSRQIGFFVDGKLKRTRVTGGSPELICDAPEPRGGSWSNHGEIVFAPAATGPLVKVRATGGDPVAVTTLDSTRGETAHRWPSFLPDGVHFTYVAIPTKSGGFACYVGSTGGREHRSLFDAATAPIYAAPGHLIFSRNEALLAQKFDLGRLQVVGDPFTIGAPPSANTSFTASPCASVSANGVLAWLGAGALDSKLVWLDRSGRVIGNVDIPLDRWGQVSLSPDGKHAAIEQNVASGNTDLWNADLERGTANRLTYNEGKNTGAVWSPDGSELLFSSTREGIRNIYRRHSDGSGSDQVFYRSPLPFKDASAWSTTGWILINQLDGKNGWDILKMKESGGAPEPVLDSRFNEQSPDLSPDGKWLLYASDESGTSQAFVQSFPDLRAKQQVTRTGAIYPRWVNAGREIIAYRQDFTMVSIPVTVSGDHLEFGTARDLFRLSNDTRALFPAPDGQRFLAVVPAVQFTPAVSVAVNWRSGAGQ